jgi:hypothetical protein
MHLSPEDSFGITARAFVGIRQIVVCKRTLSADPKYDDGLHSLSEPSETEQAAIAADARKSANNFFLLFRGDDVVHDVRQTPLVLCLVSLILPWYKCLFERPSPFELLQWRV